MRWRAMQNKMNGLYPNADDTAVLTLNFAHVTMNWTHAKLSRGYKGLTVLFLKQWSCLDGSIHEKQFSALGHTDI